MHFGRIARTIIGWLAASLSQELHSRGHSETQRETLGLVIGKDLARDTLAVK